MRSNINRYGESSTLNFALDFEQCILNSNTLTKDQRYHVLDESESTDI